MSGNPNVRGYVLAGGASSRFGTDKALAELQGKSMITRTVDLLGSVCSSVAIVAPVNKVTDSSIETVPDRWPGEGPLGGILTALLHAREKDTKESWNLVVSCDMPFLTTEWLCFLAWRASESRAEAAIPKSAQGWEPLCSCWLASATEMILPLFEAGTRKITEALNVLHVEILDERDWKRFDSSGRLFWNMNTVEDYEEARRVIAAEKT